MPAARKPLGADRLQPSELYSRQSGFVGCRIQLKAEAVRQSRQIIENADDVRKFQDPLIIESHVAKGPPILFHHARRRGAQLLRNSTERSVASRQTWSFVPCPELDGFREFPGSAFYTQKLRVRLRSIVTILGGGRDGRDHFAFSTVQCAFLEHDG